MDAPIFVIIHTTYLNRSHLWQTLLISSHKTTYIKYTIIMNCQFQEKNRTLCYKGQKTSYEAYILTIYIHIFLYASHI